MLLRQLYDARSSTYTYLLADEATREAVLIDPVFEQFTRDVALLRELDLKLRYTLETHVHADHVTAASLFKAAMKSEIVVSRRAGVDGADLLVDEGDEVRFGAHRLRVHATPGHTNGCITFVTEDEAMAFTGDALMIRAAGRTDFQQGDARTLYRSVHERIFSLPKSCAVYPAHDYKGRSSSSVGEERAHNPRLGGARSEDDFVGYMNNLGLPHPNQIDVAVPANLRAGKPVDSQTPPSPERASWAPTVRTYAGVLEIEPDWVAERLPELTLLDVREPSEFTGELGHIKRAQLIPLGELRARMAELDKSAPTVVICRSGGRSAQASIILEGAGFSKVANLAGGMIRWRALELPVVFTPVARTG